MSIKSVNQNGFVVVVLNGEIDLSRSQEVRRALLEPLAAGHPTLAEMSGVTYIDSSGIAALVEAHQAARKKSLKFGLLAVSEPVSGVLALARLDKVFSFLTEIPSGQ